MKQMTINGTDVSQGRVVKALEAMLDGADNATLRKMGLSKWDEQFYYIRSEVMGITYMVRKEFNCLTVWITFCGPTSFEGGDEIVQRQYHPLCILNKSDADKLNPEWNDVCMDLVNGLIRMRLLNADNYIDPSYED